MKKRVLALLLMLMLVASACFNSKDSKNSDSASGVKITRTGEILNVYASKNVEGMELVLNSENVTIEKGVLSIVKKDGDKTIVALVGEIKEGQALLEIKDEAVSISVSDEVFTADLDVMAKNVKKASEPELLGDFDGNNSVGITDLSAFTNNYGGTESTYDIAPASVMVTITEEQWNGIYCFKNPDGKVDLRDFVVLGKNYGLSITGEVFVESVTINGSSSVDVGNTLSLTAKVLYNDGTSSNTVTWSSSDKTVATVDSTGKVTGVKAGTATITAEKDGIKGTKSITVNDIIIPTGITIYLESSTAPQLYAWSTGTPSTAYLGAWPGKTLTDKDGVWYYYTFDEAVTKVNYIHFIGGQSADLSTDKTVWITKDGKVNTGIPYGPSAPTVSISPSSGTLKGDATITITISGDDITSKNATFNGKSITLSATTTVKVSDYLTDGATGDIIVTATNEVGTTKQTATIKRDDNPVVTVSGDYNDLRIYQVMVESYQDGDPSRNFGAGYGPSHHNGDLKGITNSLEYIKSLGMNAIWLTPIFESNGTSQLDATGYFAQDFFKIDDNFGSFEDAKEMVNKAHSLGMYVFFDGVFGHHKGNVPTSPNGNNVAGSANPVSYPGSLEYYKEVATYWIDALEIDGWRLDQAYQVSTKNQDRNYWKDIREAVAAKCAERKAAGKEWGTLGYMVGEIWDGATNINTWGYSQDGLKSCFDFPMRYSLVQVLATQEHTEQAGAYGADTSRLDAGFSSQDIYPDDVYPNLMLTNHDLVRLGDLIQRAPNLGYGKENPDYWKRHKAALSFLAAYTGPVTIYYGDEYGAEVGGFVKQGDGGYYDDHVSRDSGKTSGFDSQEQDLIDYTTKLMNARANNPALSKGTRTNLIKSGTQYADLKEKDGNKVVYVLNTGTSSTTISVSSVGGSGLRDLITGETISGSGSYSIPVEGLTGRLLVVQ